MSARLRFDDPDSDRGLTPSYWVVLTPDPATLGAVMQTSGPDKWRALAPPTGSVWSDQYASTLTQFRWNNMFD
jgi:hypothetical protein